jgi:hypothetical protein
MEATDPLPLNSEPANETTIPKTSRSKVWMNNRQPARRRGSDDEIKIVAKKPRLGPGVNFWDITQLL